jgi:chaperone modulatory protein CbpM
MSVKRLQLIEEAALICGVGADQLHRFISYSWVLPAEEDPPRLDDEDVARARLIHELQAGFGVNDAAVPIILHLIDQLHRLHQEVRLRR